MRLPIFCALLLLAGCDSGGTILHQAMTPFTRQAKEVVVPEPSPQTLRVMSWNIKFGAGRVDFFFDEWGDRTQLTREELDRNMAGIYRLIDEVRPDLLLVQEIEVNSRRSLHEDMVQGILDHTHLNHAAYFPNWRSRYVPMEGLGRVDMGNAIFSTYPISSYQLIPQAERQLYPTPLHRFFYLDRSVGRVELDLGDIKVAALVLHTEAYESDGTTSTNQTNLLQLQEVEALMRQEVLPFVAGGDFNAIPPTSMKVMDFNDEHPSSIGTEFEQPPYDPKAMAPFFSDFLPAIDLERYGQSEEEQRRWYTHSVIGPHQVGQHGEPGFWTRTLDYLFLRAPQRWVPGSTDVLQQVGASGIQSDPLMLSDHAPVVGTWEVVR